MAKKPSFFKGGAPEVEKRRTSAQGVLFRLLFNTVLWLLAIYFVRIRPWHLRWGASADEVHRFLPGDDLVSAPKISATHAVTINAHAADVWPWLVQLGWGRGGFYSYTFVENKIGYDFENADRILPEFQQLQVGDRIPLAPPGEQDVSLLVAVLEKECALVLYGDTRTEPDSPLVRPGDYLTTSWGFYLDERPDGTTRLIERFRLDFNRNVRTLLFYRLFLEPGAFLMERKMLLNIKRLVEARQQNRQVQVVNADSQKSTLPVIGEGVVGAVTIGATTLLSPALRARYNRLGATDDEAQRALPGDELSPNPVFQSTRAVTINAPVREVWRWLTQLGQDRGGMYSYEALENLVGADMHNVDRILPAIPEWKVGDALWMASKEKFGGRGYAVLAEVQPERALIFFTQGWTNTRPRADFVKDDTRGTWAFILEPLDEETTRLIVRGRSGSQLSRWAKLVERWIEPLHFVMEWKMMLGIKQRAEASAAKETVPTTNGRVAV